MSVRVGRPRQKWDDHIHGFCKYIWPELAHLHWFDILITRQLPDLENAYVVFLSRALV